MSNRIEFYFERILLLSSINLIPTCIYVLKYLNFLFNNGILTEYFIASENNKHNCNEQLEYLFTNEFL